MLNALWYEKSSTNNILNSRRKKNTCHEYYILKTEKLSKFSWIRLKLWMEMLGKIVFIVVRGEL